MLPVNPGGMVGAMLQSGTTQHGSFTSATNRQVSGIWLNSGHLLLIVSGGICYRIIFSSNLHSFSLQMNCKSLFDISLLQMLIINNSHNQIILLNTCKETY